MKKTEKKPKLTAKAIRILRKVQAHILEEPKRYNQNDILTYFTEADLEERKGWAGDNKDIPKCRTIGCIGGWVNVLSKCPIMECDDLNRAAVTLQLDDEQRHRLFASVDDDPEEQDNGWPEDLSKAYYAAKTPAGRARVGVRRIERFIKTGGAE